MPDAYARQANLAGVIHVGLWRQETDAARSDEEAVYACTTVASRRSHRRNDSFGDDICDLNLETVNWTRSWVAEVGNQPLDDAR